MGIMYATRESVKEALDVKLTARSDAQIDRAIESASRSVEGLLRRKFYPHAGTRYFDWPDALSPTSYLLWLDKDEAISVSSVVSGGEALDADQWMLRREDGLDEPPYDRIELDLGKLGAFNVGSTHQKNIAVTGVFGYSNDTAPAGALAEALDGSETGVNITDSSLIGVGDLLLVDDEYMNVTGKTWLDTALDIHATDSLTGVASDVSLKLTGTTGIPAAGEVILVDSERMLVTDVAGDTLTVKRAWDGSTLATHATGASIYAHRTLTVSRGVLGTTAAAHDDASAVARHVPASLASELTLAYALNTLLQRQAGYARVAGTGDNAREFTGRGIAAIEQDARRALRRMDLGGL